MKRKHWILLTAIGLSAFSCTYYEQPTASTPEYRTGHIITTLPDGYKTVTVSGTRYYTYGDRYYRSQGDGYVVVDSPYTSRDVSVIRELPSGYRVVTRQGQSYYQVGDVYYRRSADGYVIVQEPF